jgi:hypothetical protein
MFNRKKQEEVENNPFAGLSKNVIKQIQKSLDSMPDIEKQQCINLIHGMEPRLSVMQKQTGKGWQELIQDFSLVMLCFSNYDTVEDIPGDISDCD